jgi:2-isopropylmalate synthase/UPF0716 protein FxsA
MIYFLIYLFLEVFISLQIAEQLGSMLTFLEIIFSAILGIVLLKNFKYKIMENLMAINEQKLGMDEAQAIHIFAFIGVIFLIIPGFLTDMIGLLLQFDIVGKSTVKFLVKRGPRYRPQDDDKHNKGDVIDVEVISK